jgi:hypothetical protein
MLKKIFKNSILRERKHVEMPLRRERERDHVGKTHATETLLLVSSLYLLLVAQVA